jgi:hypothetical protein
MPHSLPKGYRVAGVHAGIKRNPTREDVTLIVSDRPASAAGVYTTNLVFAAPVAFDRARTPGEGFRAVVINSGNANACTGERGLRDVQEMAGLGAAACSAKDDQALVMSTGVIGEFLPLDKVAAGIRACAEKFGTSGDSLIAAARGMMTTDTVHKLAAQAVKIDGRQFLITGMCKGAAMIAPNMGTMLGLVLTDAPIAAADLQKMLSAVVGDTFNCISVDGHMSTNDTVLLLANGAAGGKPVPAAINWGAVDGLKQGVSVPVVVKGLTTAAEATAALQHGAQGLIVSNFGGLLAGKDAPILELPKIVDAVAGKAPVLVDGSFRRGTDVLKALAFGAQGVIVARPVMWGLAAYGDAGVQGVVEMLQTELARYMGMCGKPTIKALDRTAIKVHGPLPAKTSTTPAGTNN